MTYRESAVLEQKKSPKYLVNPKKSSTFALDFALNASEQKNGANLIKNCNAENQPLTKKMKKY